MRKQTFIIEVQSILSVFREWLSPQPVTKGDYVCQACWDLAENPIDNGKRLKGHHSVCLRCGKSLSGSLISHKLHTDLPRELRIFYIIQEWITPQVTTQ
ncbi:hypothetical protein evm_011004 [Chilo suppressalis]|nr:hypothetical protein evm_011003 [Chilo suppressalis]RVE44342.1 hypothetical protein evm_011004 [Chilo suppressalis]